MTSFSIILKYSEMNLRLSSIAISALPTFCRAQMHTDNNNNSNIIITIIIIIIICTTCALQKKAVNLSDHVADRARTDHLWGKARSHPVVAGKGPPGQPQKLQQMQCAHELCY